jgi:hypothetical protein
LLLPRELDEQVEYNLLVQEVGIRTALILRKGRNVVVDSDFQDRGHVETFLRIIDRPWGDPGVLLARLTVETTTAITRAGARKSIPLGEERVRELHTFWNPRGIEGEVVILTEETTSDEALAEVQRAIDARWGLGR